LTAHRFIGYVDTVGIIFAELCLAYEFRSNQDVRLSDWTPWEPR